MKSRDMLDELRMVSRNLELETEDFCSVDSANIFPEDWARLAELIAKRSRDYQGIAVIHGTDTLAYTASMLSFMLQNISIPVVVTGSQLSIADPVADAMENCRCGIHMAAGGCPGVFVAFNRKVMLGCRASKVRTMSFDAFESINYPYIGEISSLGLHICRENLVGKKRNLPSPDILFRQSISAEIIPGNRSFDPGLSSGKGCRGVYVEGFGLGGMPFLKMILSEL